MTSLANVLSLQYAPIHSAIIPFLDLADITALSRTCTALTTIWQTCLASHVVSFMDELFETCQLLERRSEKEWMGHGGKADRRT